MSSSDPSGCLRLIAVISVDPQASSCRRGELPARLRSRSHVEPASRHAFQ
jgi:hypothetical protein